MSLNPYCSGQWSSTNKSVNITMTLGVLILIVVDNGLVRLDRSEAAVAVSLNPYCSGQWPRTSSSGSYTRSQEVLILIVVDNGLVPDLIRPY